jgi:hypothetical protein
VKRILEIGPYCETGGVSVHIRRLVNLLSKDSYVDVIDESKLKFCDGKVFNLRSGNVLTYLKLMYSSDIVHIHTAMNWLRFIHVLISKLFFKKVIVTIHSIMHVEKKKHNLLLKISLKFSNKIIYVNEKIKQELGQLKGEIMPAFLPPIIENEIDLPEEITKLLNNNKGKKIVVSNAYRLDWYNGNDLYGFDLLLEVAKKINKNNKNIFILLIISSAAENDVLLNKYNNLIMKENLANTVRIIPYSLSFVNLILRSDLVIRATNTDGDSLTIRESLFLNKPVIGSNVVRRPKGTILFKNRDSNDLYEKIVENVNKPYEAVCKSNIDYKQFYLDLISD